MIRNHLLYLCTDGGIAANSDQIFRGNVAVLYQCGVAASNALYIIKTRHCVNMIYCPYLRLVWNRKQTTVVAAHFTRQTSTKTNTCWLLACSVLIADGQITQFHHVYSIVLLWSRTISKPVYIYGQFDRTISDALLYVIL